MIDKQRIENAIKEILIAIGEDPNREGLVETPKRVAKMYQEIFAGLEMNPADEIKIFKDEYYDKMVVVKDIPLYSMCEHHLLPFFGKAHVVYMPSQGKILGLSKLARIVDIMSKRPQLQERLSNQIADEIVNLTNSAGVLVVIEAEHLCMTMRGIKKPNSKTVTLASRGELEKGEIRTEALLMINSTSINDYEIKKLKGKNEKF